MMAGSEASVSPADPDPATAPRAGRWGWVRREWPITIVLALGAVGLVLIGAGRFREGSVLLGGGMVVGAWLRALLPERMIGLLRLRSRLTDVLVLAVLGLGTVVLALAVPASH
jgi:Protein of unknown function (DUF3017)